MRDAGNLIRENRELYCLAKTAPLGFPDLVQVARLVSKGVICLISALSFHDLPRGTQRPRLAYPPLEVIWLPHASYEAGIEEHILEALLL